MTFRIRVVAFGIVGIFSAALVAAIVVVGGAPSIDYPSVAVLGYPDVDRGLAFHCTGTLIAPNLVLTAAHCAENGIPTQVFFQHAGYFAVSQFIPYNAQPSPPVEQDIAAIVLADSVTGIVPASLNRKGPVAPQTLAVAVGFGYHSQVTIPQGSAPSLITLPIDALSGLKFYGNIRTNNCQRTGKPIVCLTYQPTSADDGSTCRGDSGGPLFTDIGATTVLTAVTIEGKTCAPLDETTDVDVSAYLDWIDSIARQYPPASETGDAARNPLQPVTGSGARYLSGSVPRDHFKADGSYRDIEAEIPSGVALLRIALNTTPPVPAVPTAAMLSMNVVKGSQAVPCTAPTKYPALLCAFPHPAAGTWVFRIAGAPTQELQFVATRF